jgi:hypothetical protein
MNTNGKNARKQLREKHGPLYTTSQMMDLFCELNVYANEDKILKAIKKHGVNNSEFARQDITRYWIPESKLQDLLDEVEAPVRLNDMLNAAHDLGYGK